MPKSALDSDRHHHASWCSWRCSRRSLSPYSPIDQTLRDKLLPRSGSTAAVLSTCFGPTHSGASPQPPDYGARVSLIVALLALTAGGGIGLAIGILAGYFGGTLDNLFMRLVDAAFTFPAILFALLLAVTMGQGLGTLVIAISLLLWASFARVIRGEVLALKQRDFVALAKVRGCSSLRDHADAHPAERAEHLHGAGDAEYRCGHHRRGVAEFPGRGSRRRRRPGG